MKTCRFDGCDQPLKARGLCSGHYNQQWAGRPLAPIKPRIGYRRITEEIAQLDIEEFEFLLNSGESMRRAVARMGICARTLLRRYSRIGRKPPAGLWAIAEQHKEAA